MNKIFTAAFAALTIFTSGAAYAGSVSTAAEPTVVSQAIIGVAGGETYPQFGGPAMPITSNTAIAVNGEQYPQFQGTAGAVKSQKMIAANGQNYPSFAPPATTGDHGRAYAQVTQGVSSPAVPAHHAGRAS